MEVLVTDNRQQREDQGLKQRAEGGTELGETEKEWGIKTMQIHMTSSVCRLDPKKTGKKNLAMALSIRGRKIIL